MQFICERYPCITFNIRDELKKRHPVTGDVIETIPAITVCAGVLGDEFTYTDPLTGREELGVDIRGGFIDTVVEQERHGWSDEEREMVERHLMRKSEEWPISIQPYSEAPAQAPFPSYDKLTNYLEIAKAAELTGTLEAALKYERQNKNRDGVVAELEKRIKDAAAEEDLVAA